MPFVEGEIAYFGTVNGRVYAINILNGNVLWKITTSGAITNRIVDCNNNLVFLTGPKEEMLYSISRQGIISWKIHIGDSDCSPLICNSAIVVARVTGELVVIDPDQGEIIWEKWYDGRINSLTGSESFNSVFFSTIERDFYCVEIENLNTLWSYETDNVVVPSPLFDGEESQLIVMDMGGIFYSFEPGSGSLQWREEGIPPLSPPMRSSGTISYITSEYTLRELSVEGKWLRDSSPLIGFFHAPPVDYMNNICLTSVKGNISILSSEGETIGWGSIRDITYATPAVSGNKIIIGSDKGYLYVLVPE
jgi:outer membrane protein assembly factor BamB